MSNDPHTPEPSDNKLLLSALGWLGVIFVFLFIVAVAYLPNRGPSAEEIAATERYAILSEVKGEQAQLISSYSWVNQNDGVVRMPIERALQLSVAELKERELPDAVVVPAP
jgi:hypothetical protein